MERWQITAKCLHLTSFSTNATTIHVCALRSQWLHCWCRCCCSDRKAPICSTACLDAHESNGLPYQLSIGFANTVFSIGIMHTRTLFGKWCCLVYKKVFSIFMRVSCLKAQQSNWNMSSFFLHFFIHLFV